MTNIKIVTLHLSDDLYENKSKNFIPSRGIYKPCKQRCQSAPFANYLPSKPTILNENKIPQLLTNNHKLGYVQNEINSALKLIENRSLFDLNDTFRSDNCKTSQSTYIAMNDSPQKQVRWKSAHPRLSKDDQSITSKYYGKIKLLSDENSKSKHRSRSISKLSASPTVKPANRTLEELENQETFLTSNSNYLSRFITIDDFEEIKDLWMNNDEKYSRISVEAPLVCPKIQIKDSEVKESFRHNESSKDTNKRSRLLREFMSVYLDWKNFKSQQQPTNELDQSDLKHYKRFISLSPHQRLQAFHQMVTQKRRHIMRQKNSLTTFNLDPSVNDQNEQKFGRVFELDDNEYADTSNNRYRCKSQNSGKRYLNNEEDRYENETKIKNEEDQESINLESEEISDIDWLEIDEYTAFSS